jgi:hypothetical protein
MRFVLREHEVEAVQWNKHGDHPDVKMITKELYATLPDWIKEEIADNFHTTSVLDFGILHSGCWSNLIYPGDYIEACPDGRPRHISKAPFEKKYISKEKILEAA